MKVVRLIAYAILAVSFLALGAGGILWQQGYRLYAVQTGSMAPTYPTGTLVVAAPATGQAPKVGSVVTFRAGGGLVTHRVHAITADGIKTKGDANRVPDAWTIPTQQIMGQVTRAIVGGGYVLVFLQQPTGVPSLVLLALSIALAWSIFFPAARPGPVLPAHVTAQVGSAGTSS